MVVILREEMLAVEWVVVRLWPTSVKLRRGLGRAGSNRDACRLIQGLGGRGLCRTRGVGISRASGAPSEGPAVPRRPPAAGRLRG